MLMASAAKKSANDLNEKIEIGDVDIRNYTKYLLRDGSDLEKRELLGCFKIKITLKQKRISLAK